MPSDIQLNFRKYLLARLSSFSGRFRCKAVQTQRPRVRRHVERMPKVPRREGSGVQIEELVNPWPNTESSIMSNGVD